MKTCGADDKSNICFWGVAFNYIIERKGNKSDLVCKEYGKESGNIYFLFSESTTENEVGDDEKPSKINPIYIAFVAVVVILICLVILYVFLGYRKRGAHNKSQIYTVLLSVPRLFLAHIS